MPDCILDYLENDERLASFKERIKNAKDPVAEQKKATREIIEADHKVLYEELSDIKKNITGVVQPKYTPLATPDEKLIAGINENYDGQIKALVESAKRAIPVTKITEPPTNTNETVDTRRQIESFGVKKEDVAPMQGLLEKLFNGLKSSGLTTSKKLGEWVGISKGKDVESSLKQIIGERGVEGIKIVKDNLARAKQMQTEGKDAKTIFNATGWELDTKDKGKWKYDLPDVEYKDVEGFYDKISEGDFETTVGELFSEGDLLSAYPELKNVQIKFITNEKDKTNAYYSPKENRIGVNLYAFRKLFKGTSKDDVFKETNRLGGLRRLLIHELQHYVQRVEGFAVGGDPQVLGRKLYDTKGIGKKYQTMLQDAYASNGSKKKRLLEEAKDYLDKQKEIISIEAYDKYRQLAGEVEARNAQSRAKMTTEERKSTMISESGPLEGVSPEDKIYLYGDGVQQSIEYADKSDFNKDGSIKESVVEEISKERAGIEAKANTGTFSESNPSILYQDANAQFRIENGKNIIEAIKGFNGSPEAVVALTHEIMHPTVVEIINGAKEGNEVGIKHTKTIVDEFNKANPKDKVTTDQLIEDNDKFKEGTTTNKYRAVQEFIAKSWEQYHTQGSKGFSAEFQKILDQITKAFKAVYGTIKGKKVSPELTKMFDDILGKEVDTRTILSEPNRKAINEALADVDKTTDALDSAKKFQSEAIKQVQAPIVGDEATLYNNDGTVKKENVTVKEIDTKEGTVTVIDDNGKTNKAPLKNVYKSLAQVSEQYHKGTLEDPDLIKEIITKDISDENINKQRRMFSEVQTVGHNKGFTDKLPKIIKDFYDRFISSGDRGAIRALETKESIMGEKKDRLAVASNRINKLIGKDVKARAAANTVLSKGYIDDKIDSFTNKSRVGAISVLTEIPTDQLKDAFDNPNTPENIELLKEVNDKLAAQTENGTKTEIDNLVYNEVIKDKSTVRDLATKWVNANRDIPLEADIEVARQEIEAELMKLSNGKEIIESLKDAHKETMAATVELLKTEGGRELLSAVNEARDMVDEFSRWVDTNLAAMKIKDKDIGMSIMENAGLYLKKTYDYWTDKDFTLDQKVEKQALDSIKDSLLPTRLSRLAASKGFEGAGEAKRARMVKDVVKKAEADSATILGKYISDITSKKEFKPSQVYPNESKVNSKNTWERQFINEEFGRILGRNEDAIERLHASVIAQAQIQSAAEMGMMLESFSGERFFNSKEEALNHFMEQGMTAIQAGEKLGKGYKEVNDKYSPIHGKLIPVEIYDTVYEKIESYHLLVFDALKLATVVWRGIKTIYNPSGHFTNAMGGHISIMEQGHVIDSETLNFLKDRIRMVKGTNKLSPEAQAIKNKMVDTGVWGTSVDIGELDLLLSQYSDINSGDKNKAYKAMLAAKKIFQEKTGSIKRYYSATDDLSKLILFNKKKDIFAQKFYGVDYDKLSSKQEAVVDANIAERVKQNMPTMSRLPKIVKEQLIPSFVLGDFQGFRFGAMTSFINTLSNSVGDINKGHTDKSLTPDQKKAYLLDGYRTLTGVVSVFALDRKLAAMGVGTVAMTLGTIKKGMFDDEEDKDGKNIGSRFEFYQGIKNSALLPGWAMGQNMIVAKDDGKGNLELINLSNTFPNDEAYKLLGAQEGLPIFSNNRKSATGSFIVDTFGVNATIGIFDNVIRGRDNWNRPIENTLLGKLGYVAGEYTIPSISNLHKQAEGYAKGKVGETPRQGSIDKRRVTAINYMHGLFVKSPQLTKRTHQINLQTQVYYNLKSFYEGNKGRFKDLTASQKYERLEKLEPYRETYLQLKKYEQFSKGKFNATNAFERAFSGQRGMVSKQEEYYILTGKKPNKPKK